MATMVGQETDRPSLTLIQFTREKSQLSKCCPLCFNCDHETLLLPEEESRDEGSFWPRKLSTHLSAINYLKVSPKAIAQKRRQIAFSAAARPSRDG